MVFVSVSIRVHLWLLHIHAVENPLHANHNKDERTRPGSLRED